MKHAIVEKDGSLIWVIDDDDGNIIAAKGPGQVLVLINE